MPNGEQTPPSHGGGAATNAGIGFQQRVSAYLMVHMLLDLDASPSLGLERELRLRQLSLEAAAYVDDIVAYTDQGRLFLQAKRTISISTSDKSEFSKAIGQFVRQYLLDNQESDRYLLVTTSSASSRITKDLRKITESIRLNDTHFAQNPLSQTEREVLEKTSSLVRSQYELCSKGACSKADVCSVLQRLYIAVLDLEPGDSLEAAILIVLATQSSVSPDLLWANMQAKALMVASQRQSINRSGLKKAFEQFLTASGPEQREAVQRELVDLQVQHGPIAVSREFLLVESGMEKPDLFVMNVPRFESDGSKRIQFHDGVCVMPSGAIWKVLRRTATGSGLNRCMLDAAQAYQDKSVVILENPAEEDLESTPAARAYRQVCERLIKENSQLLRCLHCGEPISEDCAPSVEIDEDGRDHEIGLVHNSCLRALDRVLGSLDAKLFRDFSFLKSFDFRAWFYAHQRGQGLFRSLHTKPTHVYQMMWNPQAYLGHGKYCVRINLEDGSSRYLHHRGKVVRGDQSFASKTAEELNERFLEAKARGDPWCYTSRDENFSTYSTALGLMGHGAGCILCVDAEPANFNRAVDLAYSQVEHFYAPLILLLEAGSGMPLSLDNAFFLLSKPLSLNTYLDNWRRAGFQLPDYVVTIIPSDEKFDAFFAQSERDNKQIIVDPLFDLRRELTAGLVFHNIDHIAPVLDGK